MEKNPVIRRRDNDIDHTDRKTEKEILDPFQRVNPFVSFRYSSREISSVGGKTYLRAKEKSFVDGKFKSEEFEGVAPGNLYGNMATEIQKMFLGQIATVMGMFPEFLPGVKKDKKD
ncbi:MAG: hypothetical protein WCJ37_16405 [Syntrophus sp. (in: bacteria)]